MVNYTRIIPRSGSYKCDTVMINTRNYFTSFSNVTSFSNLTIMIASKILPALVAT